MKILGQMQRKAAIWVTGAFRTSPTGGVQAIAGLLPIHLHIRKLSWRASFRTATLSATHPARSLMGAEYRGAAVTHDAAISQLTDRQLAKVRGTIVDAQDAVAARMMWLHDHVVEGASSPVSHLDKWREQALSERHTMVGITSCSVPANKQFQSTCGWALQHAQTEWIHRTVAGRFRTPDAELTAIRFAFEGALQLEGVTRIVISHRTCPQPSLRVTPPSTPARVFPWQCVGLS